MITSKTTGYGSCIYIQIPRLKQPVPLFIVFRAMGIISDMDICEKIILNIDEKKYKKMKLGLQGSIV